MPIHAKVTGTNFERPEAGTYSGVCQSVHDIGVQETTGKFGTKQQHQIIVVWEIDETIKTPGEYFGKHFVVSKRFTLSLNEKATLRNMLTAWRGRDFASTEEAESFDIEKIIGAPCLLTLVESEYNGKTYTNVNAVAKLAKGMTPIKAELPSNHPFPWIDKLAANSIRDDAQQRPTSTTEDDMDAFNAAQKANPDPFAPNPGDDDEIPF